MVREKRQRTLAKITSAVQSNFGSEYRIEVFGSTQYGVDGQTSDLDLVVIVSLPLGHRVISTSQDVSGPG